MKKNSYVYIVTGSEDGVIGTFTSYKKAVASAEYYVAGAVDITPDVEVDKLSDGYTSVYAEDSWVTADVNKWVVE